jgi:hypothetical protein
MHWCWSRQRERRDDEKAMKKKLERTKKRQAEMLGGKEEQLKKSKILVTKLTHKLAPCGAGRKQRGQERAGR